MNNLASSTLFNPVVRLAHNFWPYAQQKMNNLFQVDENSTEQYLAANIVLGC